MTIEREIELLKEKVALLERIKDLQEIIAKSEDKRQPVCVPCPVYLSFPAHPSNDAWPTTAGGGVIGCGVGGSA